MHRLRSLLALALAGGLAAASTGCIGVTNLGPGGATPGAFYTNVAYPNQLNPNMDYQIQFDRDDIELLGPVSVDAESSTYVYVVSLGDSGYGRLMDQVRSKGGDGVMNVTIDTDYTSIFFFYANVKTHLTGQAYKYKRR